MWMNSGLLVTFDPQIKPITKSECSSAIFTCEDRKRKTDDSQAKLEATRRHRGPKLSPQPWCILRWPATPENSSVRWANSLDPEVFPQHSDPGPPLDLAPHERSQCGPRMRCGMYHLEHNRQMKHNTQDSNMTRCFCGFTFILMNHGVSDVGKLSIFKDEKVVLFSQSL